ITATNTGPSDTTSTVSVTDTVPVHTSFVRVGGSGWACSSAVTCTIGGLTAGQTAPPITLVVRAVSTGTAPNVASVGSGTADPNPANNTSSTVNTVISTGADLVATKSASPSPVVFNNELTYTIVVTNNGPDSASNPQMTDQVPAN